MFPRTAQRQFPEMFFFFFFSLYPLIQNDYRQEKIIFELFSGALQENPVIAPGQLHEKMFTELFW